jgi:hypothetical protein
MMILKKAFDANNMAQIVSNITKREYESLIYLEGIYSSNLTKVIERILIIDSESRLRIEEICQLPFLLHDL